jgi:hypothetical protein
MIGCWCDEEFTRQIDAARGHLSRSQFARDALSEKLEDMGVEVPRERVIAPDRSGKGGPRKITRYPAPQPTPFGVNDQPAKTETVAADLADVARAKVARGPQKSPPTPAADRATSKKERRVHGAPKR